MQQEDEVQRTEPSTQWKELSIDTFNLSPKVTPRITPPSENQPKSQVLNTIKSCQEEEEIMFKIEELENKVFTLESENKAL